MPILIKNVKSAVTCECGCVVLSPKSIYLSIRKCILHFHIAYIFPCAVPSTVYFHTVLSTFHFLVIDLTRNAFFKRFTFVYIKGRPSVKHTICNG